GADLVFGNLESPIAPTTGRPGQPFVFNAPEDLPYALKASGFAVLATANNHAFDQGPKGTVETLERLERLGLTAIGSGRNRQEAHQARIFERKGLRIAFLAYTDLFNANLNGDPQRPWVAPLDDAAIEAVRAAKAQADLVVVSLHWGIEYEHRPRPRQREMAAKLVAAGADLLLGHHPHVLQPLEWIESGGRRGAAIFSLGNFISNQDRTYAPGLMPVASGDSRDGAALVAMLRKDAQGAAVESVRVEPLWTHNNWRDYTTGQTRQRDIRVLRATDEDSVKILRRRRAEEILRSAPPST
ncbi:MAG: CapA family protein, partial [Firmicutes bacterium]|nr:CapA family protein [Bacillota bacterium]